MTPQLPEASPSDEGWVRIAFSLRQDDNGYPSQKIERLWARRLDDGNYQIDNIPFLAEDISLADVVAADKEGDDFVFRAVIRRGGHSTVRVHLRLLVEGMPLLASVRALGCSVSPSRIRGVFVVDVPPEVDYGAVVRILDARRAAGWWSYDEGALADSHANASSMLAANRTPQDDATPIPIATGAAQPAPAHPDLKAVATLLRGVSAKQRDFLARSRADHLLVQPRLADLERRLLQQGGASLVFRLEPDLDLILGRGQHFSGRKLYIPGRPSDCHRNVARFWRSARSRTRIVTGWALCDDGLWRQHSWLAGHRTIIETTAKRKCYFGAAFSESEAESFAAAQGR